METKKSQDDGKENSPSHENIGHLQFMKRDVESLEDFEDITKDVPSMIDATAQFLQFETSARDKSQTNYSLFPEDDQLISEAKASDDPSAQMSSNSNDSDMNKTSKHNQDKDSLEPLEQLSQEHSDLPQFNNDNSFQNLLNFEGTDQTETNSEIDLNELGQRKEQPETKPIINILAENKLQEVTSNENVSGVSDDSSYMAEKESSSLLSDFEKDVSKKPLGEWNSNENLDMFSNSQPLSKFTSEPGNFREQESEMLQGDGLHVKENDGDTSENDDFIPEPIPKDYPEIGAIEGVQFLAAIGLDTWFHPELLNPKIESLVYWRHPKKSGIVFGSVLVVLLSLTSFSLISVVAYASLIVLSVALVFRLYKNVLQAVQKTSEGHPFKEYLEIDLTLNPDKAREISDVFVSYVNKSLTELRRLFLVEDVIDSAKFGIILWCLTYVGAWFNGLSLLIIAFVGLFTLPKVYENNKAQIDANIDIVKTKINEVTEKIKAVIPVGKKTEEVKDKGE